MNHLLDSTRNSLLPNSAAFAPSTLLTNSPSAPSEISFALQESYSAYCTSRFGRLINRPSIFDMENEEYAEDLCRDVWATHFPSEPFDLDSNEIDGNSVDNITCDSVNGEIVKMVRQYAGLADRFASLFVQEGVYHVAARRRYVRFLDLMKKVACATQECTRLVPSLDILLMWLAHQVYVDLRFN